MTAYRFTTDGKTIGKNIDAWAKVAKETARNLHVLVVSAGCHAIKYNDATLLTRLDVATRYGKDAKGNTASAFYIKGMREWIRDVFPVKWSKADKANNKDEQWKMDAARLEDMKAAYDANPKAFADHLLATEFWKIKGQAPFKGFDLDKVLAQAANRADEIAEDDDKSKHPKNNLKRLAALKKFLKDNGIATH